MNDTVKTATILVPMPSRRAGPVGNDWYMRRIQAVVRSFYPAIPPVKCHLLSVRLPAGKIIPARQVEWSLLEGQSVMVAFTAIRQISFSEIAGGGGINRT